MNALAQALVALLVASAAWAAPADGGWTPHGNARFGTFADVPANAFEEQPPPENGDGSTFLAKDGAELRLYGGYAEGVAESFASYKSWLLDAAEKDGLRVTYKAGGKRWLAYSGLKGDEVVYRKVIEGCGAVHTVDARYPRALKSLYDPIVARVAGSLRCHRPRRSALNGTLLRQTRGADTGEARRATRSTRNEG